MILKKRPVVIALLFSLLTVIILPVTAYAETADDWFSKSDYNDVASEAEDAVIRLEGGHGTLSDTTRGRSGNPVVINRKGVYRVTGQSSGVTIRIEEPKRSGNIYLILDNAQMTTASAPCIEVLAAEKVILQCVGENSLTSEAKKGAAVSSVDDLTINGTGSLRIKSGKNGIHCRETLRITGSGLTVQAENDGIKGDLGVCIDGGSITVTKCYEGLEGGHVLIRSGELSITASDDGLNAAGDPETQGDVVISGGRVYINAAGDAIDSNHSILIEGGTTLVDGPANSRNSIFDKGDAPDAVLSVSGGTVLAVGSAEKAKNFKAGTQYSRLEPVSGHAGDVISTDDGSGVTLTAAKDFGCVIYSSPSFTAGSRILVSAQAETEGPAEAKPEWDTSVPAEITDEVRTLFDEAMKGLLGVHYEPLAVLAQQGETVCILCRASAVVPDAKPNYALVYLSTGNGSPVCEQISELPLDLAA
ncbi:MAG: carbohydrate-binding domain-containing protein [Oscillospiraceae bacterium]|nr:carbohydrate-binding domain-containing protein [Oscillospiraceae bacterium]